MITENDIKYAYGIKKLAISFKTSNLTSDYEEVNGLIQFAETILPELMNIDERIFYEVVLLLSQVRDYPLGDIILETDLHDDLDMTKMDRMFLRKPFNKIIMNLGGNSSVTGVQCQGCVTVENCVELIKSKL